jgi:hypothetical protein
MVLLMLILTEAKLLAFGWSAQNLLGTIREESMCWIQPDDGLYWDVENLFMKGGGAQEQGAAISGERFNEGVRFGAMGTIEEELIFGLLEIECRCQFKDTCILPTYQLRTAKLIEDEILPELEKLLDRRTESPINKSEVYVVDASEKEHDYLKVYHLHKSCQYVQGKSYQTMSTREAMDAGFRPCVICLKKEIAKSYKSLL